MAKICEYGNKLAEMSIEEVIQAAEQHLLTQGEESEIKNVCQYKSPDGKCCGAAPFLQNYKEEYEGRTWKTLQEHSLANEFHGHDNLISTIQLIHDKTPVKRWEMAFDELRKFMKKREEK